MTGHLHIPATRLIDGVRFEEVSFGYPHQRASGPQNIDAYLREILPGAVCAASRYAQSAPIPADASG